MSSRLIPPHFNPAADHSLRTTRAGRFSAFTIAGRQDMNLLRSKRYFWPDLVQLPVPRPNLQR
jgi:hypothetical protein